MSNAKPTKGAPQQEVDVLRARVAELEGAEASCRQALEAARKAEAAFAAVFQNAPTMMLLLDGERRICGLNRAAREMAARVGEEVKGVPFGNAIGCTHALDKPDGCGFSPFCKTCPVRRVVSETLQTGQAHREVEATLVFGTGEEEYPQHLLVSTSLTSPAEDGLVLVCIQDVTERKQAEAGLRNAHELLERLFAATHLCIAYMDTNFNFIRVNRAYAEADGCPPESLVGKNHFDLYPDEENKAIFRRVAKTGQACSFYGKPFEYAEHPERGVTYWDWSLHPVKDAGGRVTGLLLCLVDVTKREQAEKLARERQAALAHVSRMSTIAEMASGLAHELGQPLGAVCTYADACKRMVDSGALAEAVGTLGKIGDQARRAAQIVARIRGFVGKRGPERSTVDVNDLVQETVKLTEPEASEAEITVSLELSEQVLPVQADAIQIQQVIVNLVRNAIAATRASGGAPRTITIQSAAERGGGAAIAVCDTGIGLRDEVLQHMFEPFFTTKPAGLGLGLSISRSIIKAHGGRLWATRNPAGGATFRFTLPAS